MSIQDPIEYMIAHLEAMPFFTTVYGLSELLDNGKGKIVPVHFPNGAIKPKEIKINKLGAAYFRKRERIGITENKSQNFQACATLYTYTVPLRLVAITKREYFPLNNAYSADRLASTIVKAITTENGQLKRDMNVQRVTIRARTYSTDIRTVKNEEFQGIENPQFNLEDIAVALDVDVRIDAYAQCLEEACSYLPKFYLQLESYIALP